jgi:hypothetical protein
MTKGEHLLLAVLFCCSFSYCLYGAIAGDLYIAGKRGPGVHLNGLSAWLVTLSPIFLYFGLLIRSGMFHFHTERIQGYAELLSLGVGVFLLFSGTARTFG